MLRLQVWPTPSALIFVEGTQDPEWKKILLKVSLFRGRSIIVEKKLIYICLSYWSVSEHPFCVTWDDEELLHKNQGHRWEEKTAFRKLHEKKAPRGTPRCFWKNWNALFNYWVSSDISVSERARSRQPACLLIIRSEVMCIVDRNLNVAKSYRALLNSAQKNLGYHNNVPRSRIWGWFKSSFEGRSQLSLCISVLLYRGPHLSWNSHF